MPAGESRVRVLLVDDEDLICRTLQRLLKPSPRFEVHTATNYIDALATFRERGPFEVLVTDLRLHDISGVELAERLRARNPELRVVFMSGDVPRGLPAFAVTIEKPFDRDELVHTLEAVLKRG